MKKVYLDNAATTPLDPEVMESMLVYMREHHGNPSAIHSFGRTTRAAVEQSRRKVAALLNCSPGEIIFTSGGTEADNMAIMGSVRDLGVKNVITSPIEHHAVEYVAHALEHEGKARVHWLRLLPDGQPDMVHLEEMLKANPHALVSLMHANNKMERASTSMPWAAFVASTTRSSIATRCRPSATTVSTWPPCRWTSSPAQRTSSMVRKASASSSCAIPLC